MTGYGKSTMQMGLRQYQVEIKSVNHRYSDVNIKMPRVISYLEEDVKKQILSKISRGKIDVFITYENSSSEANEIKINKEIAKMYIKELKNLAKEENILANIEVTDISKFPDVLTIKSNSDDETIKNELLNTVNNAIDNLVNMRKQEGEKISCDLLQRLEYVENKTMEISAKSTGLIEEYVVKLEERIKQILKEQEIDQNRLAQEIVIYADKCSIQEEITRLNSHIAQFKELLKKDEPVGKRIDFLIQEMNRETNTIGSKSNSLEITNTVIEMKTEIENLREQIQNVE